MLESRSRSQNTRFRA